MTPLLLSLSVLLLVTDHKLPADITYRTTVYRQFLRNQPDTIPDRLTDNKPLQINDVYFEQSTYVLRPGSLRLLNELVETMQRMPQLSLLIAGHTDTVGDRRLNKALSDNRAKAIQTYLIRHGIAENRLQVHGFGDTQPIAPNDTEENRQKNRRVEFVVLAM